MNGTSVQPCSNGEHALFKKLREGDILATDGCYEREESDNTSKLYAISLQAPADYSNVGRPTNDSGDSKNIKQKVGGNAEVVRIQVLESLGSGGFGSVYRCIKRQKGIQNKQDICLKLSHEWDFSKKADTEVNRHIIREIETFQRFKDDNHDNVIQFFFACYCAKTDRVFLGLEYFSGFDLSKFIKFYISEKKRFPVQHINTIIRGVVRAVIYAQEKSLVHCDIKPNNVMFNCFNEKVKLIDFGCAVRIGGDKETFGGTSEYMAPEMLLSHAAHAVKLNSTDVYGVGALLYHLLTLERPWHHHNDVREALKKNRRRVKNAILNAMSDRKTCYESDGSMIVLTPLQSRLRDIMQRHYQIYPDHCDLASSMLEFDVNDRHDCEGVLAELDRWCVCPQRRRYRRAEVMNLVEQRAKNERFTQQLVVDVGADPNIHLLAASGGSSSNKLTGNSHSFVKNQQKMLLDRASAQTGSTKTSAHSDTTKTATSHSGTGNALVADNMEFQNHSNEDDPDKEREQGAAAADKQPDVSEQIKETPKHTRTAQAINSTVVCMDELGNQADVRPRTRVRFARQVSTPTTRLSGLESELDNQTAHSEQAQSSRITPLEVRSRTKFNNGGGDYFRESSLNLPYTPESLDILNEEGSPIDIIESPEEYRVCDRMQQDLIAFIKNLPRDQHGSELELSDHSISYIRGGGTSMSMSASMNSAASQSMMHS